MRSLLTLLVLLTMNVPVMAADAAKDEVYGLADEFGICGGNFYALENVFEQSGKAKAAQSMRDIGDGYTMGGGWVLFFAEKIPNLGKAQAYVHTQAVAEKTRLNAELAKASDDTARQASITAIKNKVKACNEAYGEAQRKNAENVRKYGRPAGK